MGCHVFSRLDLAPMNSNVFHIHTMEKIQIALRYDGKNMHQRWNQKLTNTLQMGFHNYNDCIATWFIWNDTWHSRMRTCGILIPLLDHHYNMLQPHHVTHEVERRMDLFAHSHAQPKDFGINKLIEDHSLDMEGWIWIESIVLSCNKSNMDIMGIFGM